MLTEQDMGTGDRAEGKHTLEKQASEQASTDARRALLVMIYMVLQRS